MEDISDEEEDGGEIVSSSSLNTTPGGYHYRNQIGFWLLGLFNNFAYVIMLSAAHDLLAPDHNHNPTFSISKTFPDPLSQVGTDSAVYDGSSFHSDFSIVPTSSSGGYIPAGRDCNPISTGSILLANIIPAIFVKLLAPFVPLHTTVKVAVTSCLSLASFVLVSQAASHTTTFIGVALASLGSGLGEVTFLAFTHKFDPMVVSGWSSGTGGAGVFGAGTYALLTLVGLSPRTTVLLMAVVPLGMFLTYICILKVPDTSYLQVPTEESASLLSQESSEQRQLRTVPGLLKYMIPLGLVYFFEYVINQGLFELLYFPKSSLSHSQQYRWYQLDYQLGVLVSRSSLSLVKIPHIKLLAALQMVNLAVCLLQSIYWVEPYIWPIFIFIFWEGLLGGAAYVNTFYRISTEVDSRRREFSLGISSLADSASIGLAGAASLGLHTWICDLPAPALPRPPYLDL